MDLEFTAARAMYAPPDGNAPALRALASRAVQPSAVAAEVRNARAGDWVARGAVGVKAQAFGMAHESFRHAASLDNGSFDALRGSVTAAAGAGRLAEEIQWLRERAAYSSQNAAVYTALSYSLALAGDMDGAVAAALDAQQLGPDNPETLEQLASVLADLGDPRLSPVAETLIRRFPDRQEGRFYQATALLLQNRGKEAETVISALLQVQPGHAKGKNLHGIICASHGNYACAISAFEASLKLDPRDVTVYVNLGNVYLERGDVETAGRLFSEAVALDPTAERARAALRQLADRNSLDR